ncbi:hypothetical protein HN803_08525 [candidate division WWE3 bacterium]|jgi:hypothetical protein|nr:hypothetical protein [candidate division WWE3 bacterium]
MSGILSAIAAAAGVAIAATGTGMSFAQASKQRKLQQKAESDADKALQEARAKLDVNYMEALAIKKEPYELAREAMLVQGAQAIEAGKESERGAAAIAGRVQLAQQEGQQKIRSAMNQEMFKLEQLKAAEDSRLRDIDVQLDLGEIEGAQMAASDAQRQAAAMTAQGFEQLVSTAGQAANVVPLFTKGKAERQFNRINKDFLNSGKATKEQILAQANKHWKLLGQADATTLTWEQLQPILQSQNKTYEQVMGFDVSSVGDIDAPDFWAQPTDNN